MLRLQVNQIKANSWNCNFLGEPERVILKQRMSEDGSEKTLPVVVRLLSDGFYELVDGEHRWTIAKELGWDFIEGFVREADDLQSKALCVSYNRLRGRLNWFKLYEIVCKDLAAGVNVEEAYKEALSTKEFKWLLSLGNLIPKVKVALEDALKKYPEITLEQLYLLSLFPVYQQERLIEKFKNPLVTHALMKTLTSVLQQNLPYDTKDSRASLLEESQESSTYFPASATVGVKSVFLRNCVKITCEKYNNVLTYRSNRHNKWTKKKYTHYGTI